MAINYSRLRSVTVRDLIRALEKDGFELDRQRGSHQQYRHGEDGRRVTVAVHSLSAPFKVKTLKTIVEQQARWDEEDLKRLKLMK